MRRSRISGTIRAMPSTNRLPRRMSALALIAALAMGCSPGSAHGSVARLPCPTQGVADYPGEPGFESPREALTWALATQKPLVTGPGDEDDYTEVPRSGEWIDFEYQVGGEVHHTWEVILQDGQWAIGARSGCQPEM